MHKIRQLSRATVILSQRLFSQIVHNVIIVGSGPSGHTAAIYCSRANLEPLMFEGFLVGGVAAGGQLTTTTVVENYPGFPDGVGGIDITRSFREQSLKFGTKIETETVTKVDVSQRPFKVWTENKEGESPFLCKSLIIATGAAPKRLHLPGENDYWQKGVSTCAVCDGAAPIFRKKELAVIGGGDSAAEEALFLTKYASTVYMIVRRDQLRASSVMQQRVMRNSKIKILWNTNPVKIVGDELMTGLFIRTAKNGITEETLLPVSGLFYAIGHTPNTSVFKGQIELDEEGYIKVGRDVMNRDYKQESHDLNATETSVRGVFACGDVQDKRYRQAITAAGTGCMAALEAERFLQSES